MGKVTLDSVTKCYSDVVAVDDMDVTIEDGEFVTFVGPSGCGKSTTMETIAGLTQPTEGTISISGRTVTHSPPKDRGIAMVFQNIALFPHMDVYNNVSFGLRLRDFEKEEIDRRVEDALEIVQMDGMDDRMPDELSGGQRQRVAISRAIVRDPDVFLMDEPLANLDAKLRVHMRTEIQRLHRELETTIIYVTHDQAEAMTMSDRIAVLNNGELQQIAPPLECYNEPANQFVASFIGSPSMNFLDGSITPAGIEMTHGSLSYNPTSGPLADEEQVTVGIRPEDVYEQNSVPDDASVSTPISATVDVLEPMGDVTYAYLLLEEQSSGMGAENELLMATAPSTDLQPGDQLSIVFNRSKLHIFDTAGKAVHNGIESVEVRETM